ncbi:MAG: bifunctional UDP-N-acetylglucosamine diphosphorylase/glucosamine-1-phosphate N-acetyltransferase GlmU [Campylobacterales bacterium]|nr:bifunctional UDP-N-acetylglucosamine diphosphorylase/glucosamine-1-phosphate N-acetyltransferase GlmU [Campylobacterales bacterium]
MSLSIVILAAGKGSRMKSDTAKVLHSISGRPMLHHITQSALALSDDVIIVIAHQKERVRAAMAEFTGVRFVEQDTDNFPGTGGAMMGIQPKYERVLVLNGDMPLITPQALEGFLNTQTPIVMSIFKLDNPDGYGRVIIGAEGVERIVEQKDATSEELHVNAVNAGVYSFSREVLKRYIPMLSNANAQKEYYLTDVIALARRDGVHVEPLLVDEEHFKGVNSKFDLSRAETIHQERLKRSWMEAGVIMQLPQSIYIESDVVFEGECVVENGVRITGKSRIVRSAIKAHSVVEESVMIDSDCGPMAHLRPKSHLERTHVGNFVETKNARLTGVKAGHLSYLGDATIDEGSNIGAGTITCNYDGKKKYETRIGKNVFIGSDTQIVAPCVIADDVIVAAGTTVTRDVEQGALAISRTKMSTVSGFFYKFFGTKA